MKPCHCDKYGVIHVFTPECDSTYNGPNKPEPMSLYPYQGYGSVEPYVLEPLVEALRSLSEKSILLEQKINFIEQRFKLLEKLVLELSHI